MTNAKDALVVEAALPGIKPDDVEITVENGTLSIRGESQLGARPPARARTSSVRSAAAASAG